VGDGKAVGAVGRDEQGGEVDAACVGDANEGVRLPALPEPFEAKRLLSPFVVQHAEEEIADWGPNPPHSPGENAIG
jgi:hypothetical protein